jgi:hypothetical protein
MVKRDQPAPLRYFLAVRLHPTFALVILAAIVAVGLATLSMQPDELDAGLGMVLFAQMFLASTGFVSRSRQGHFDPLLTRADKRVQVAAAHWLASIAPGVAAWAVLTVTAALAGAADVMSAIGGARAAALLIVSALAWGIGFWLPRGAAGMLWMALLMGLVMRRPELLAVPAGSGPLLTLAAHTATLIACPFLLLGKHPPLAQGALAASVVLPLVLLCGVCRRARALDVYLVDRT